MGPLGTHRIIYARFKSKKKRVLHGLPFEFYASAGKCTAYTWAPQGIPSLYLEGGLGLRLQVRIDMGVAENKGPQYSTLNRILILRTPKEATPYFWKLTHRHCRVGAHGLSNTTVLKGLGRQ